MDFAMIHDAAARRLKDFYKSIKPKAGKVNIELMLGQGLPSSRVYDIALERKADLIVMGATGKGLAGRAVLGSNASRIIRNSPCLVLVVPPKAKFNGLKKIVYSTDLTNDSIMHTRAIMPLVKLFNSELIFLHVNSLFERPELSSDVKSLSRKIKDLVRYEKTSGYISNDENVNEGINNFLKKHKADCLAMFTHHRNVLGNLFHKSITKKMSYHTDLPLLVIHEKDFWED
jgi:nucleotide-binding universal stress UspA family protein